MRNFDNFGDSRILCHFSAGIASAVATKIALNFFYDQCEIVNMIVVNEHIDNDRFKKDCEQWFGKSITYLISDEYGGNVNNVIEKTKYIRGPKGARCTIELKKKLRFEYQTPDDIHVFGFTNEKKEIDRAERLVENSYGEKYWFPLIECELTKKDCFSMFPSNIEIPTMYKLGFPNNNCIACNKASSIKYWLRTKKFFPIEFEQRAKQSRELNYKMAYYKGEYIFLDDITDDMYDIDDEEISFDCDSTCSLL